MAQPGAVRVVVAVLTYRRPGDLGALLPILLEEVSHGGGQTQLLVVDNDPDGGAREQVLGIAGERGDAPLQYVHEPQPGIAAARNRALDEAGDADLLVFIDDDERPGPDWLRTLLRTWQRDRPQGVVGPVVSTFEGELDPWLAAGGFFDRRQLPTGTVVVVAATNNLLLDLRWVRSRGLRFDRRFGLVGGSDNLFTRQLTAAGGRLVWCAEAAVTDIVPATRMTRSWALRRAYRMGNGTSLVELELAEPPVRRAIARARQVLLGGSRLLAGILRVLAGTILRTASLQAAGARNCARGLGLITGAFGHAYAEYDRGGPTRRGRLQVRGGS